MSKTDEIINKSLDEIDAMVAEINKGITEDDTDLVKAVGGDESAPTPDEVSEDAPTETEDESAGDEEPTGDDGDVDDDTEPEEDEAEDEEVEKSLEDTLKDNASVKKALEISEFLDTLVKGISADLSNHSERINKSLQSTDEATQLLAKSFEGIAKSQKAVLTTQVELMKSVKALTKRLQKLEAQPQVRKSVASSTQVVEKSFANSASAGVPAVSGAGNMSLSKAQISAKLLAGVQEGKVDSSDLIAFDSLGTINAISPAAQNYISSN
ncbi:hypothetical protein D1872_50680 [compost metagenome]